jgi:hypothetical protein
VQNSPLLQSLTISCDGERVEMQLTETAFEAISYLCLDLEEFSCDRQIEYAADNGGLDAYYERTAASLVNVLRRCSKLKKVSLTGDSMHCMKFEDLLPFGHLFHELRFGEERRHLFSETGQVVSNFLTACKNLKSIHFVGNRWDDEEETDRLVLSALAQSCPLLEELVLSHLPSDSLDTGILSRNSRRSRCFRALTLLRCFLSDSCLRSIAGIETLTELWLDSCYGLTGTGVAELATMKLVKLSFDTMTWTELSLQSFVVFIGSNISQTLESFELMAYCNATPMDDVQIATALASCHQLKSLIVHSGEDGCLFGRDGLDGLQAMATGCPLLAVVSLPLTVSGVHYLGAHFTSLRKRTVRCRRVAWAPASEGFPSIEELQTLYPAVEWRYSF